MAKNYKEWSTKGLEIPDEILQYTEEYRATNNHFREFVADMIEDTPNSTGVVSLEKLYDVYREWYRENNSDNKIKKRKDLKIYLDEKFGKYWQPGTRQRDKGYRSIRIMRENL